MTSTPTVQQDTMFGVSDFAAVSTVTQANMFTSEQQQEQLRDKEIGDYKVIGQLWNAYIIMESSDAIYYIDQHALAERILFEKIKS